MVASGCPVEANMRADEDQGWAQGQNLSPKWASLPTGELAVNVIHSGIKQGRQGCPLRSPSDTTSPPNLHRASLSHSDEVHKQARDSGTNMGMVSRNAELTKERQEKKKGR